jgi:hypothetical protein
MIQEHVFTTGTGTVGGVQGAHSTISKALGYSHEKRLC